MAGKIPKSQPKPYSMPVLTVYGNVRELTQSVGNSGSADGGGPPNKTTFGPGAPPKRGR